jgi:pentose-5-phosphate-3-epimerase
VTTTATAPAAPKLSTMQVDAGIKRTIAKLAIDANCPMYVIANELFAEALAARAKAEARRAGK